MVEKLSLPSKSNAVQNKINEIIDDYVSNSSLATTLAAYVTGVDLTTILNDYALKSDLPTNYLTTDTAQNVSGRKTFLGEKAIYFKQITTSNKLGFTLYNPSNTELGALEYRPSTIGSASLLAINCPQATGGYVGFRYWGSPAVNIVAPKVATAGNYYIPTHITDGNTTVTASNTGSVNISSLLPDISTKQDTLVSGTNIKTINNTSLLGSGNIDTSEVFVAEYNVTPASDILTAYNSGKSIICKDGSANVHSHSFGYTVTEDFTPQYVTYYEFRFYTASKIYGIKTLPNDDAWFIANNNAITRTPVNNGTLTIQKNGATVSTFSANASNNATCNITVPTATSELTNDSNFATVSQIPTNNNQLTNGAGYITGITSSDVTNALGYTPYNSTNPNGYISGITSSDVETALGYTPSDTDLSNLSLTGQAIIDGKADTDLSNLSATGKTVIDGQWVSKYKQIDTTTSIHATKHNLGTTGTGALSYLPADCTTYDYEVFVTVYGATTASGVSHGYAYNKSTATDGQYGRISCNANARHGNNSFVLPIYNGEMWTSVGTTAFNSSFNVTLLGYRRLGTNT